MLFNTLVITICTFIMLMVVAAVTLNTNKVQNKLMLFMVEALKEDLKKEPSIGHVNMNVWGQHVDLHELKADEHKGREMLHMNDLSLGFYLHAPSHNKAVVSRGKIDGPRQ